MEERGVEGYDEEGKERGVDGDGGGAKKIKRREKRQMERHSKAWSWCHGWTSIRMDSAFTSTHSLVRLNTRPHPHTHVAFSLTPPGLYSLPDFFFFYWAGQVLVCHRNSHDTHTSTATINITLSFTVGHSSPFHHSPHPLSICPFRVRVEFLFFSPLPSLITLRNV